MLTIGIILLSIIALLLLNVLNNYMTGGELDYYLVKETADAAMLDAVDNTYAVTCGLPRIDKEKFVESFVLRFGSSIDGSRDYELSFFDINEVPPKVSVRVDSLTVLSFKAAVGEDNTSTQAADITTEYSAILESNYISDITVEEGLRSLDPTDKSYDTCRPISEISKGSN